MQCVAHIVETCGRRIERQQLFQLGLDPQQISHGILVLDSIESPQDDSPLSGALSHFTRHDTRADPIGESLHLILSRLRLRFWRHLTRLDPLQHGRPRLAIGLNCEVGNKLVEPQVPLRLFRPVALHAMRVEKRTNLLVVLRGNCRLIGGRGCDESLSIRLVGCLRE